MRESLTIEVEHEERILDVLVTCEFSIENSGIGAYEFWGHKQFDRGSDFVSIDSVEWDKSIFSVEENAAIEAHLAQKDCESKLEEELLKIVNDAHEQTASFYSDEK